MAVSHRLFKQPLYAQFARVGTALASDKRLELLDLLAQAPRHVDALAAETGLQKLAWEAPPTMRDPPLNKAGASVSAPKR